MSFQSRLAEAHRELFAGDYDRLARAAKDGRAAAVAVRERFLAPDRVDARSLQQALELAAAAVYAKLDWEALGEVAQPWPTPNR